MKLMLNGKEVTGMGHYVMAGDIKDATAEDSNVLSGKVYYNNNGKREGTMPNRGGMSAELAAGGSVSIQEGYHDGTGSVRAQDLASQTAGTAAAANIEAGYTAWVNGVEVEGTAVIPTKIEDLMTAVQSFTPPQSYYLNITFVDENNYIHGVDKLGNHHLVSIKCCTIAIATRMNPAQSETLNIYVSVAENTPGVIRLTASSTSYKLSDFFVVVEEVQLQ